jgi:hypothetical protein
LYRDDGTSPVVASTTGGGSITLYADKVYTVAVGSAVLPSDIVAIAAAVLAAADVAPIHSDIRKVNNYTVTGDGTVGDPWGPV